MRRRSLQLLESNTSYHSRSLSDYRSLPPETFTQVANLGFLGSKIYAVPEWSEVCIRSQ